MYIVFRHPYPLLLFLSSLFSIPPRHSSYETRLSYFKNIRIQAHTLNQCHCGGWRMISDWVEVGLVLSNLIKFFLFIYERDGQIWLTEWMSFNERRMTSWWAFKDCLIMLPITSATSSLWIHAKYINSYVINRGLRLHGLVLALIKSSTHTGPISYSDLFH